MNQEELKDKIEEDTCIICRKLYGYSNCLPCDLLVIVAKLVDLGWENNKGKDRCQNNLCKYHDCEEECNQFIKGETE